MERGRGGLGVSFPDKQGSKAGEESQHHGGSFAKYMAHKSSKLQEQFQQMGVQPRSSLFAGVVIHVDGITTPSQAELKMLMALHGGGFQQYPTRSNTTHIVASNLPDAKVKEYERARNPTPVVRPEWVVDSIRAQQLLPVQDYLLCSLRDAPGQRTLLPFVQPGAAGALGPSDIYGVPDPQQAQQAGQQVQQQSGEQPVAAGGAQGTRGPSEEAGTVPLVSVQREGPDQANGAVMAGPGFGHSSVSEASALAAQPGQHPLLQPGPQPAGGPSTGQPHWADQPQGPPKLQGGPAQQAVHAAQQAQHAAQQQQSQHDKYGGGGGYDPQEMEEAQRVAAQMRAECDVLRGAPRSSRDDPQFVETFYKSSRLHFIGTWKARLEAIMATVSPNAPAPTPHYLSRQRSIIHIDMDCFFASVAEASNLLFKNKPLAVCHSSSSKGTGEVSSANYEARRYGVAASMFISWAKELCPHLIVVPYDFAKYEAATEQVYRVLLKYSACVQPISCDEAFVDITGLGDPQQLASRMRADIEAATGCTASAGIGPNLLLARLATRRAKPNGQFMVAAKDGRAFLSSMPVGSLPGVGWSTESKLKEAGLQLVSDIQGRSKEALQQLLGKKSGAALWEFAQGRDTRAVEPPKARKSVGAEVNWGVRFGSQEEADAFLRTLAGEVHRRLREAGVRGRTITLKLMRRKEGANEPVKFLGHGVCDNLSRSVTLARFTDAAEEVARCAEGLLRALRVPPDQIRGMGIAVSKLDNDAASTSARPSAPAPAKLPAPPPSRFDPAAPHPWAPFLQGPQQAPRAEQGPQQQRQPEGPGGVPPAGPLPALVAAARLRPPSSAAAAAADGPPCSQQVREWKGDVDMEQGRGQVDGEEGAGEEALPSQPLSPLPPPHQHQQAQGPRPEERTPQPPAAAVRGGPGAHLAEPGGQLPEQHRRLLARYEGRTLAQIPADELADLPYAVQRALIELLPRDSVDARAQQGRRRDAWRAGGGGKGPEMYAAAPSREASCEEEDEQDQEQQQEEEEEEGGWEPRAKRLQASGPGAVAAQGGGMGSAGSAGSSPIQALPAFSQLDPAVLDALPLHLKRELEEAYGIGRPHKPAKPRRGRAPHAGGHPRPRAPKRQRLDAFLSTSSDLPAAVAGQPPAGAAAMAAKASALAGHGGSAAEEGPAGGGAALLSYSQVDPSVLEELPAELRQEVLGQLAGPAAGGGGRKRQRAGGAGPSRLGQRAAAAAAWDPGAQQQAQHTGHAEEAQPFAGGFGGSEGASEETRGLLEELPESLREWVEQSGGLHNDCAAGAGAGRQLGPALEQCLQDLERHWGQQSQPSPQSQPARQLQPSGQLQCKEQSQPSGDVATAAEVEPTLAPPAEGHEAPGKAGASQQQPALLPPAGGSNSSSGDVRAVQQALAALRRGLLRGCRRLVDGRLDEVKSALDAVQRLGRQHPWWAEQAHSVVEGVQAMVEAEHGWRLRLGSCLEE